MKIEQQNQYVKSLKLSNDLINIIENHIENIKPNDGYITLSFRDPTYSSETGGYHPVEILINADGQVQYITDFSMVISVGLCFSQNIVTSGCISNISNRSGP